jgi:S-formylglutathione hydrolase FrmB
MDRTGWLGFVLLLALAPQSALAIGWRKDSRDLVVVNKRLAGKVVDYTANHGKDQRMWSRALGQRRDLYVYLPPGFDPNERYPFIIYLHGFGQDEQAFLLDIAPEVDKAITDGKLPPVIVAAPDGSFTGEPCHCAGGSFFLNTQRGNFEDFVVYDVWDFVARRYPLRCERDAHVLLGISMGGFGAFNLGIKHRDGFGVVAGICPPVNLRWIGKDGDYQANFTVNNWGWRTEIDHTREIVGRFLGGTVKIRLRDLLEPVFGLEADAINQISQENPIEMIDRYQLSPGELAMFIAYNGKDEYNIDAQVESFVYVARRRGLTVDGVYERNGKHLMPDMVKHLPAVFQWLAPRLAPYSPPRVVTGERPAVAGPAVTFSPQDARRQSR